MTHRTEPPAHSEKRLLLFISITNKSLGQLKDVVLVERFPRQQFARAPLQHFSVNFENSVCTIKHAHHDVADGLIDATASCSVGVLLFRGCQSLPALLAQADELMYRAKDAGKGRVIVRWYGRGGPATVPAPDL